MLFPQRRDADDEASQQFGAPAGRRSGAYFRSGLGEQPNPVLSQSDGGRQKASAPMRPEDDPGHSHLVLCEGLLGRWRLCDARGKASDGGRCVFRTRWHVKRAGQGETRAEEGPKGEGFRNANVVGESGGWRSHEVTIPVAAPKRGGAKGSSTTTSFEVMPFLTHSETAKLPWTRLRVRCPIGADISQWHLSTDGHHWRRGASGTPQQRIT